MVETTHNIVSKNNRIDTIAEDMLASLLDMEASHKKLVILKKERYSEYFDEAKNNFETTLQLAVQLCSNEQDCGKPWHALNHSYIRHKSGVWDNSVPPEIGYKWVTEQVVTQWIDSISRAKRQNQIEIEKSLRNLNEQSRVSAQYGLYGFCISILVGFVGVWVISRSVFSPLNTLTKGLKRISLDKSHVPINLKGGEEFNEIADTYNNMSKQLSQEENIRNEFIATLSHEIRTPLSSIRESVNLIAEEVFGSINDKQRKFLVIAGVEIQRINKLLNYLLNVSVLESETRKKNSSRFDTHKLIVSSVKLFASLAEKKNITITINNSHDDSTLYGVREELQQVFVNIIGNAVKYSPNKGEVSISWKNNNSKHRIVFQVSDTGPGIDKDELSLVFTKYYRTKNVRGHLDGVGLGLAISRKIITNYGGWIKVTNNDEVGCTFSFSLPTRPE